MISLSKIFHRTSHAQDCPTPGRMVTSHEWGSGQWVELGAILWMVTQACIAFALALATSSVVLLGIALDSGLEAVAGSIVFWRLFAGQHHLSVKRSEQGERLILRIAAICQFALASYLVKNSVLMLAIGIQPRLSWWSIALAVAIVLIQPLLWQGRQRVPKETGGARKRSESTNRINAFFLPWTLLIGLLLHSLLGWWWTDPLAALVVVILLFPKAWEATRLSLPCSAKGTFCSLSEIKP